MKLVPRTYQIFWDVHAWTGVIGGLVLFVIFFAGTFALFRHDLDGWSERTPGSGAHAEALAQQRLQPLLDQLDREEGAADKRVVFVLEGGSLHAIVRDGDERPTYRYDIGASRLVPVEAGIGTFLYRVHYLGPIRYGIYIAGVVSLAFGLALVTGLLIHLKDFVRQWLMFRPDKAQKTWMIDLHKLLGVLGLPYQMMYAWTGAVICLAYVVVVPTFTATVFDGDRQALMAARGDSPAAELPPAAADAPALDLDGLRARARSLMPGAEVAYVSVSQRAGAKRSARFYGQQAEGAFATFDYELRVPDGAVLKASTPATGNALQRFEDWFVGLHYARFGGFAVRVLYALLAFAGCAVCVSGNLIWLERRDRARAHVGNRILERLTIGVAAGLPLATAALFVINRLAAAAVLREPLPEALVFGLTWLLAAVVPLLLRRRGVARVMLLMASAGYALALVLDLMTAARFGVTHGQRGVDLALAAFALAAGLMGALLRARRASSRAQAAPRASYAQPQQTAAVSAASETLDA